VIRSKTAKLFEAAADWVPWWRAPTTPRSPPLANTAARWAPPSSSSTTCWITGDASEIGKNVGDDLREGKPTLPLIYLMENGTAEQRELVVPASNRATSSTSTPSWPPSPAAARWTTRANRP
jgi:octaprenyl-diphosphate synthase